jgi:4-hydroxy-2-oxoheptanedioate aldolase
VTGFGADARGVWCIDATPGMVARLGGRGFDWLCLDAQHGTYGRRELIAAARTFPADGAELVVRAAVNDFAAVGEALDAGATTVIVPQVDSPTDAARAVAATFYPPRGGRSWGQFGVTWGRTPVEPAALDDRTTCAVMIESATALGAVESIAAVPGVGCLFVGPYDLSLTLGTTVDALLDDDAADAPLARVVAAGRDHGVTVGAFAGTTAYADRFAAHGITCLAVATDLGLLDAGVAATLDR